jgi:hypothetical protein
MNKSNADRNVLMGFAVTLKKVNLASMRVRVPKTNVKYAKF